jgi:hypothetical protein
MQSFGGENNQLMDQEEDGTKRRALKIVAVVNNIHVP